MPDIAPASKGPVAAAWDAMVVNTVRAIAFIWCLALYVGVAYATHTIMAFLVEQVPFEWAKGLMKLVDVLLFLALMILAGLHTVHGALSLARPIWQEVRADFASLRGGDREG